MIMSVILDPLRVPVQWKQKSCRIMSGYERAKRDLSGSGGGVILPFCWFPFNNSGTVKAVTLGLCSIQ